MVVVLGVRQLMQDDIVDSLLGIAHQMVRKADGIFTAAAAESSFGGGYFNGGRI